ncbi:Signal peptide, CUB and EGF-like domain-containing protein 2 [Stylophora pistillata]|uniref:Signal peptide, CUB and EGF-like domain-containing protein 2 n=1 Tax=Stylophora pistillata TaxID=50429 RepID=A0A2B4SNN3_STYPI|nr:Signal peptide, CUB and EGF-like domain-containing protein 2 [Stylophora pistillata]
MDPPTLVELNQSNEERKGRVRTEMLKPEETEKPRILTEIVRDIWADNHIPETYFWDADQCRQLKFTPEKEFDNKRLKNHVIRIVEVMTINFCENMCYMEPNCVSINIEKRVGLHGGYSCELNNVTHEGHELELEKEENYFYHAAEWTTEASGVALSIKKTVLIENFIDVNECTEELHSCSADAVCTNTKGSYNCTCNPGYSGDGKICKGMSVIRKDTTAALIIEIELTTRTIDFENRFYTDKRKSLFIFSASSCKEVYEKNGFNTSGVKILHFGSGPISIFCHMGDFGCGNGGWTPVMKIDGNKETFHYDSLFWSNTTEYNSAGGMTGFDSQETKLPSYWNTSFSKICLGMRIGQTINFTVINKRAESLYSLIADGQYRQTSLGRDTWKKLVGSKASLQTNCNKEGFNLYSSPTHSKAKIGIISNEQNDCESCDSRIGFGTGGYPNNSNTCGNVAKHHQDNGDRDIKAMGYILVH